MKEEFVKNKPAADFKCRVCDDRFFSKKDLIHHIQTIHKTCRVKCKQCDKEFPNSIKLENHLKEHGI